MYEGNNFHAIKAGSFSASTTGKYLPCLPSSGQAPVSGGVAAAAPLPGRRLVEVTNEDTTITVRAVDTGAPGSGGRPIFARQMVQLWVTGEVAVLIVADSGTPLVSWLEYA